MKQRSIRFKITAWFAVMLIAIVSLTFVLFHLISSSVLKRAMHDYLVSSVEMNVDDVIYITDMKEAKGLAGSSIYIAYGDGYLEIDDDFLDVIDDVRGSLYTEDGALLYGINPIARTLDGTPLTTSRLWTVTSDGVKYDVYDRRLAVEGTDGLYLRGVMPQTQTDEQLREMTRMSLFVLPVLVFLSVVGGTLIAGRLLKPLRDIERSASEISGSNDLKKRINMQGPDDEVHRLAATFDDMIGRLDDAFETERRFTSDASHELRTPMSVILAQCEYTLDKERTTGEYVDALRTIRRQGARMNGLINDMLDYTRMEQKAERYPLTDVDLSALVRTVCADMAMIRDRNITLYARVRDGIRIQGNQMLLTRLLQNLITNAYRYGREDGTTEVRLTVDDLDRVLNLMGVTLD